MQWGMKQSRLSTNISLYLGIGLHDRAILLWKANRKLHRCFRMNGIGYCSLNDLQWPIINPDFKVTIIQRQITQKQYNIEPRLVYNGGPFESRIGLWSIVQRHFNDLEGPLPPVSRSGHSLTLNISDSEYRHIISIWNTNRNLHTPYSTVSVRFSNDLEWSWVIDTKRRAVSTWASCSFDVLFV